MRARAALDLDGGHAREVDGLVGDVGDAVPDQVRPDVEEQDEAGDDEERHDQQRRNNPDEDVREDQLAPDTPQEAPLGPDDEAIEHVAGRRDQCEAADGVEHADKRGSGAGGEPDECGKTLEDEAGDEQAARPGAGERRHEQRRAAGHGPGQLRWCGGQRLSGTHANGRIISTLRRRRRRFGRVAQPPEIGGAPAGERHDDELRDLVGMELGDATFERLEPRGRRLDDHLALALALDCAMPRVDRLHLRQDVDARGQALADEGAGEGRRVGRGRPGGEDDDGSRLVHVAQTSHPWRSPRGSVVPGSRPYGANLGPCDANFEAVWRKHPGCVAQISSFAVSSPTLMLSFFETAVKPYVDHFELSTMSETGRVQASARRHEGAAAAPRRRSIATLAILLVALVLLLDGIAGERGWLANRRAAAAYREAQQALEDARAQNAALREQARRLQHDPAAIEEAARSQLGLMKKGEKVFILRDRK